VAYTAENAKQLRRDEEGQIVIQDGKRAPVQEEAMQNKQTWRTRRIPNGSIAWEEHLQAHQQYCAWYGSSQSAERIAERGGFGVFELICLLGRPPLTWREEPQR
jgi:hypothetical protein